MSKEAEIGTLIVVVLKARNLNDKHTFRKQDAYAKVALNGTEKKTRVDVKGGQHPVWDDEIRFPVLKTPSGKLRKLELSCWSKEPREDDLLGKATLDISDTIRTGEFDDWIPLAIDDTIRGDIYLEMTYYSHGPPPPSAAPSPSATPAPALSNILNVPQSNLMRRPSKMSASERLSRPNVNTNAGQKQKPPQHNNSYGTPSSPYGPSAPSHYPNKNGTLPPVPEAQSPQGAAQPLPAFLRPGASSGSPSPRPQSSPPRPGYQSLASAAPPPQHNPYLNPAANPSYNRPVSTPPNPNAQPNPYQISTTPSPNANPYASPVNQYQPPPPIPVSYTPVPHHTPPPPSSITPVPVNAPTGPPPLWAGPPVDPSPGGFSFPVPTVLSGAPEVEPYQPPWAQQGPQNRVGSPYDPQPYGQHRRVSDPRADHVRYQTPLPLPPGERDQRPMASSPPPPRRDASPVSYSPPSHSPRPTVSYSPPSHSPRPPPASPPKPSRQHSGPDYQRLQELMVAEQDAKRRREQEQKDMELAMQLDRELNF